MASSSEEMGSGRKTTGPGVEIGGREDGLGWGDFEPS